MKTYFIMYCFKSVLTPTTLYLFSTFLIYIIFLLGFYYQLMIGTKERFKSLPNIELLQMCICNILISVVIFKYFNIIISVTILIASIDG